MSAVRRPSVAMVQAWIPQYRAGFHEPLRARLESAGIDFTLVQGQPYGDAADKDDAMTVPFAHVVEHRVLRLGSKSLSYQPCLHLVRDADLVIGDQQSARLINYVLLARHLAGRQRFALWGHGKNFQPSGASSVGETVKRWMSRRVHWWFAYNETSAAVVRELGFPADRITDVQNAIDTRELAADVAATTDDELARLRATHGLTGDHVAVYVGAMYAEKRLGYLIEACDAIRAEVPDFEMLFLGGGPDVDVVRRAAASRDWMHVVGPTFGAEKAHYLRLARVLLMPGLVGLAVLDAFAAGTPLITVADSAHSPEIEYLVDGDNGRLLPTGSRPADYAKAVAELLRDDAALGRLVDGCDRARQRYTMEAMVERFATGVEQALDAPTRRTT